MSDAAVAKTGAAADTAEGMSYLSTLPQRVVNVYTPLALIVLVLLFPFYWMVVTAVKPNVPAPPLIEWAARKIWLMASLLSAPTSSSRRPDSISSRPSSDSSKKVWWNLVTSMATT